MIEHYLHTHPQVQEKIVAAIGAPKDSKLGPADEEVRECRAMVAALLGADLQDGLGLTELCAPLMAAWARAANDPDLPMTRWLVEGHQRGSSDAQSAWASSHLRTNLRRGDLRSAPTSFTPRTT